MIDLPLSSPGGWCPPELSDCPLDDGLDFSAVGVGGDIEEVRDGRWELGE